MSSRIDDRPASSMRSPLRECGSTVPTGYEAALLMGGAMLLMFSCGGLQAWNTVLAVGPDQFDPVAAGAFLAPRASLLAGVGFAAGLIACPQIARIVPTFALAVVVALAGAAATFALRHVGGWPAATGAGAVVGLGYSLALNVVQSPDSRRVKQGTTATVVMFMLPCAAAAIYSASPAQLREVQHWPALWCAATTLVPALLGAAMLILSRRDIRSYGRGLPSLHRGAGAKPMLALVVYSLLSGAVIAAVSNFVGPAAPPIAVAGKQLPVSAVPFIFGSLLGAAAGGSVLTSGSLPRSLMCVALFNAVVLGIVSIMLQGHGGGALVVLLLAAVAGGVGYGWLATGLPLACTRLYGPAHAAAVYGLMMAAWSVSAFGPTLLVATLLSNRMFASALLPYGTWVAAAFALAAAGAAQGLRDGKAVSYPRP